MSRIEIPIEEYKAMKDEIKTLENRIAEMTKTAAQKEEANKNLKEMLEDIEYVPLINRIFKWKKTVKGIKNIFLKHGKIH